jgi:hypothetical protein
VSIPIVVEVPGRRPGPDELVEHRQVGRRERAGAASPLVDLALTEARRMVLHPVFLVSVLLTAVAVGAGWRGEESWGGAWWWAVVVVPWVFLWVGTLVRRHRRRHRPGRGGADPFPAPVPLPPLAQPVPSGWPTAALLLTAATAAALQATGDPPP